VAGTRARDRLVIPFIDADAKKKPKVEPECLNDWLRMANGDAAEAIDITALPPVDATLPIWKRAPDPVALDDVERIVDARARWIASHDALIARASAPLPVRTASALKPEWERPAAPSDDIRRGTATEFGSAVHAVLERTRLRDDGQLDRIAAAVAGESGLESRADEIARIARRALESDVVRRARQSERVLLEAPFTLALPAEAGAGGGVAEGRIDLLFEEDGQAVIVDFKTDAVSASEADERAEYYRNQALVYAWAVSEAAAIPVRQVIFLFARPGVERTYAVGPAFLEEARRLVASPAPLATPD
jgi:ATP-dependent exoDNAse (exonuclease V) beta subunit